MTVALLIATAALTLSAPAIAETPPQPNIETRTFEGFVNFSREEFQFIADRNRYERGVRRPCVSGALPRDLQRRSAVDIAGQKVRITGTVMVWSDDLPGNRYTFAGSNIRNECDSEIVILATDITPIA